MTREAAKPTLAIQGAYAHGLRRLHNRAGDIPGARWAYDRGLLAEPLERAASLTRDVHPDGC